MEVPFVVWISLHDFQLRVTLQKTFIILRCLIFLDVNSCRNGFDWTTLKCKFSWIVCLM